MQSRGAQRLKERSRDSILEAIIFIGLQASGKSTLYLRRFFRTHVRINLDMLKTRHREATLLHCCLAMQQRFVVDNTNPTKRDRMRYIEPSRSAGFRVVAFYFRSSVAECLQRNAARPESEQVPARAIPGTAARLERPALEEGFDEIWYVRQGDDGGFIVEEWRDEV